ncbi:MAG: hypothetical protein M3416_21945 [Acidobacteriota bacterium]|nr:hypothetical protein [Acidobacteriota bacterium]
MLDVGNIASRVRETVGVVQEAVTEAAGTVARFLGADGAQGSPAQADAALHNVARQVTTGVTPGEQRQIEEGVEDVFNRAGYGYGDAAIELASQLRNRSAEYQAAFMSELYDYAPSVANDILRGAAGGNRHHVSEPFASDSDRYVIARALGEAYDRGQLPADFVGQLLSHDARFSSPPNNEYTGTIVGLSGSEALINAYVDRSLEMAKGDDPDWVQSFNLGAARAMAGDPQVLQQRLERMSQAELRDFLAHVEPEWHSRSIAGYDSGYNNALATLVRGAADIQPPTEQVLNLFSEVAQNYMGRVGVADAMGELFTSGHTEHVRFANGRIAEDIFHSNAEFFTHRLLAAGKDPVTGENIDEAGRAAALRNFFQATAFNEDCEYKEAVRAELVNQIRSLQSAIEYYPNVGSRTRSLIERTLAPEPGVNAEASIKEQLAFRLGRLTGTIFKGFEAAVEARGKENAEIDGVVDFLFGLVPVGKATDIVKARVPGAGLLIDRAADKGVDFVKDLVKDWLHQADLEAERGDVWAVFAEFANNLNSYHSDDFYSGAGSIDYTLEHSGR